MAERSSPDKSLLARVISVEAQGTHTLEVPDVRKGDVLAERAITVPVGYHAHIVSLTWSKDSRTVTATIDHDFGDGNRVFDLRTEHTNLAGRLRFGITRHKPLSSSSVSH